jgi:hypothetical protein
MIISLSVRLSMVEPEIPCRGLSATDDLADAGNRHPLLLGNF